MTNYYEVLKEICRIHERFVGDGDGFDKIFEEVIDPLFSHYFGERWDDLSEEDKWCEYEEKLFNELSDDQKVDFLKKAIEWAKECTSDIVCPVGSMLNHDDELDDIERAYNALSNSFLGTDEQPSDEYYETLAEKNDRLDREEHGEE